MLCIINSRNLVSHVQVLICYSSIIGTLESVINLNVTVINSTTVFISWSPPFTLEGVPILWYIVTITSGENVTVNNTWLYYPCHEPSVDVTVVAVNGAGDGYPATLSKLAHTSPSGKSHYFLCEDTCIQICVYMYNTFSSDKHCVPTGHLLCDYDNNWCAWNSPVY